MARIKIEHVLPFYDNLNEEMKDYLLNRAVIKHFNSGDFLSMEGDTCFFFPIVISGEIRVYKLGKNGRELSLYRIGSGESCILTTTCILNRSNFPAMAAAVVDSDVLLISAETVNQWFMENSVWRSYLLRTISHRVFQIIETVENVTFKSVEGRLAEYLLGFSSNVIMKTHQEIANEIGTAREVVSRLLKEWTDQKIIELKRGIVIILKPNELNKIHS